MRKTWQRYLDQVLPLETIDNLVIYTDHFRFWLAEGLLDVADQFQWKRSLLILEEITDEEGMEVRQSMGVLSDTTLLVVMFSDRNPIIDELGSIFPLLRPPTGFAGYSLITHQSLPDQFFVKHLNADLFKAQEFENIYRQSLNDILTFDNASTFLEAICVSQASFPYMQRQHILLPATELIIELNLNTVNGTIVLNNVIGEVIEREELIDPFGLLDKGVTLLVEEGQIIDIQGDQNLKSRIENIFTIPTDFDTVQLSIGLGPDLETSGFIEHDRLLFGNMTISWYDKSKGAHFEGIIGNYAHTNEIDR